MPKCIADHDDVADTAELVMQQHGTSHEPRLTPNICAAPDLTAASCAEQPAHQSRFATKHRKFRTCRGCQQSRVRGRTE